MLVISIIIANNLFTKSAQLSLSTPTQAYTS